MKEFLFKKTVILKQVAFANFAIIVCQLITQSIKGYPFSLELILIINFLYFLFRAFQTNVLKVKIVENHVQLLIFKGFRLRNLSISNKNVVAYFEKKVSSRGTLTDILKIEDEKNMEVYEISDLFSGFEMSDLKEIESLINNRSLQKDRSNTLGY